MAGLLASLLSGCAGGESQAKAADERFVEVAHVEDASTTVRRSGSPFNTQYHTEIGLEAGLSIAEQSATIDQVLVIAREELAASANVGYAVHFASESPVIDIKTVIPLLGSVGDQISEDLQTAQLRLSQDVLKAYESPGETA